MAARARARLARAFSASSSALAAFSLRALRSIILQMTLVCHHFKTSPPLHSFLAHSLTHSMLPMPLALTLCARASPTTCSQNEREAEKGREPSGGIDCHGSSIERLSRPTSAAGGWDVEFAVHTADRVLTLRCQNDDSFRLWTSAIVAAGGRAPLQEEAMGPKGKLLTSKSGRIILNKQKTGPLDPGMVPPQELDPPPALVVGGTQPLHPSTSVPTASLPRPRPRRSCPFGEAAVATRDASRSVALMPLPHDLDSRPTLDLLFDEASEELIAFSDEYEVLARFSTASSLDDEPQRKSFFDVIGDGIAGLFGGASERIEEEEEEEEKEGVESEEKAAAAAAAAVAEEEEEEAKPPKGKAKRDTPANLPKLPATTKKQDKRVSMVTEEEEGDWDDDDEEEEEGGEQQGRHRRQRGEHNDDDGEEGQARHARQPAAHRHDEGQELESASRWWRRRTRRRDGTTTTTFRFHSGRRGLSRRRRKRRKRTRRTRRAMSSSIA